MQNSQGEIRKLKKEIEKGGYKELIFGRPKTHHGVYTQIGRLAYEFQMRESSEESHELEREEYPDSGGLGGNVSGRWISGSSHHSARCGGRWEEKRNDP